MLRLFAFEALICHNAPAGHRFNSLALFIVRSLLTTSFPLALMVSTRVAVCVAAFVNLINSLTNIFLSEPADYLFLER